MADLAPYRAEDFGSDRGDRLDYAATVASRALVGQQLFETLAGTFASHLNQTQLRNFQHRGACFVAPEGLLKCFADALAITLLGHVDEIDDDYAADVAQAELVDYLFNRFEIGLEHGLFLVFLADEATGVYIDRSKRFGLIEDQVPSGFEPDLSLQRALDLWLDIEVVEDRLV